MQTDVHGAGLACLSHPYLTPDAVRHAACQDLNLARKHEQPVGFQIERNLSSDPTKRLHN